jgi:hypothetical protein
MWDASLNNRVSLGRGCPCCRGQKESVTNSLATVKPSAAAQWHPSKNGEVTPADVIAGSNKMYWFNLLKEGIVLRSLKRFKREVGEKVHRAPSQLLTFAAPEVAAQWHPTKNGDLTPADVTSGSRMKRWWLCDVGPDHEWEASPNDRVGGDTGCLCCRGLKVSVTNSVASLSPMVAAQWHPTKNGDLTPADVTSGSVAKRWWQCDMGSDHKWEASPNSRVGGGSGCPCCSSHQVSVTNSLASLAPEVAAQWHPTKNEDLTPTEVTSQVALEALVAVRRGLDPSMGGEP